MKVGWGLEWVVDTEVGLVKFEATAVADSEALGGLSDFFTIAMRARADNFFSISRHTLSAVAHRPVCTSARDARIRYERGGCDDPFRTVSETLSVRARFGRCGCGGRITHWASSRRE